MEKRKNFKIQESTICKQPKKQKLKNNTQTIKTT